MSIDCAEQWLTPEDDDPQQAALEEQAGGKPFVFIVADSFPGGGLAVAVNVGNGITNPTLLRNLLRATLDAIPVPAPDEDTEVPS
jgi:hypothetical protein